ncbi:MAG: hypothetical protein IT177_21890 [Acidobacteria bacterium]|nr:hypothetical protein [Acidobacteriota bacterium]
MSARPTPHRAITGAAAAALVLLACPSSAQPADVSGQAEELLYRVFVPATPETASFVTQLIGQQLATFPVGSSSGSFSEVVDESDPLAAPLRAGVTHGPLFAERTLTLGRQWKASAGISVQYAGFSRVADWNLDEMPLRTVTAPGYEAAALLDMKISSTTVAAFANLALRRNLDVGITVPTVRLRVTAAVSERENGTTRVVARGESEAYGLGDIALRVKYRPGRPGEAGERGLALAGEARLPTGESRDLLGAGRARVTGTVIYTTEMRQAAPHVNFSYTRWLGEGTPAAIQTMDPVDNVFGYAAGVAIRVSGRVTAAADFVGRHLVDGGSLAWDARPLLGEGTRVLAPRTSTSYMQLGTAGVKVALGNNWLGVGHLTFPVRTNGLRPSTGFAVGVEREFH